jgi:hypothetical protein
VRIHLKAAIPAVATASLVTAALATLGLVAGVSAAGNTVKLDPSSQTVDKGAAFTVNVIIDASVALSGAQASVTFDPKKVQVTTVTKGDSWSSAPINVPAKIQTAIDAANKSGKLAQVATAFLPPGSVPAGRTEYLVIGFTAVECGTVILKLPIGPKDAFLIDGRTKTYGLDNVKITTTGAAVGICGPPVVPSPSPTPTPKASAKASPTPTASASPSPSPTPTTSASASASAAVSPSASAVASPSLGASPAASEAAIPSVEASSAPSAAPSVVAVASAAPTGAVDAATASSSAAPDTASASSTGSDSGGTPWLLIGLVVVVAVAVIGGGAAWLQRSRKA